MRKIIEIALFTDQVEAVAKFFEQLCDAPPVFADKDIAVFHNGDIEILIHAKGTESQGGPAKIDHVAFGVEQVDLVCEQLVQSGLRPESGPADYDWGRSAYFRDPDGRMFEIYKKPSG